jgi:hypothetical protein
LSNTRDDEQPVYNPNSMTEQDFEHLRQMRHEDVQDENGIDVTQIDELLSLSPTDRLRTLEEFLEFDDALTAAREKFDAHATRVAGAAARRGG